MKEYLKLCLEGESSIPERQKILDIKLKELNNKINGYKKVLIIFIGNRIFIMMF